jgi:hypothetical protein
LRHAGILAAVVIAGMAYGGWRELSQLSALESQNAMASDTGPEERDVAAGNIATATAQIVDTPRSKQPVGSLIPADRATTWNPGLNSVGGIPMRTTICATVSASTYGNGTQNAANGIQSAIDECPVGQVVMLSAGDFKITNHVLVNKGITLRGQGPTHTKLKMPPGLNDNLITIGTQQWIGEFQSTDLASDAVKGSQSATLVNNPGLTVGEIVLIDQLTDPALVSWGSKCPPDNACRGWFTRMNRPLGQVMEIAVIDRNTITFTTPFHIDFRRANTAQLSRFGADWSGLIPSVKYAGVEDLYLSGGSTGGQGNINMTKAAYSWIKNIESDYHDGRSVALYTSFRSVIRDSYIHSAQHSNPGGGAYGLAISNYSSDNLIENNIVWRMNKVMVMQSAGGGNVIAYNYMDDGLIDYTLPWMESGINASHMAGSHMELFEGNQSFNYDAENTWGSPIYITAFRNHLTGKRRSTPPRDPTPDPSLQFPHDQFRRAVSLAAGAWWHTLVGNVLGYAGMSPAPAGSFKYEDVYPWRDDPSSLWRVGISDDWGPPDPKVVSTLIRGGNYDFVTNQVHWENVTQQALPNSLYLTGKPAFFGTCTWPWVDPTGSTKTHILPAKARFDAGTPNTGSPCGSVPSSGGRKK